MPQKTTPGSTHAHQSPSSLLKAISDKKSFFFARNAFSLSLREEADQARIDEVVQQFSGLLSDQEIDALRDFYAARDRVNGVMRALSVRTGARLREETRNFLGAHAEHLGDEAYAFLDESTGFRVVVQVDAVDSCRVDNDGNLGGFLRVNPRKMSTETWPFRVTEGKVVVRTEADLY